MKRKLSLLIITMMLAVTVLAACGGTASPAPQTASTGQTGQAAPEVKKEEPAPAPEPEKVKAKDTPMQYIKKEDLKLDLEAGGEGYVVIDCRKEADFAAEHIKGAYSADLDAAKNGDYESGIKNLETAIDTAVGTEPANPDNKYVLVCYSGKSYAQQGTDLLIDLGVDGSNIYTLEGGMKAWTEAGDDFAGLLE